MSSECYKTSNNKHFNCPPRMDDGRHFTDYRPNCAVNNLIRANNQAVNSFTYKKFLTDNAEKIMQMNRAYACQKNCCGPCSKKSTQLPHETEVVCNKRTCSTRVVNPNGVGQGRSYGQPESESKCEGFMNGLPYKQPYNCCASDKNLFNYYDDVSSKAQGAFTRHTVPSGGDVFQGGDPKAYNH